MLHNDASTNNTAEIQRLINEAEDAMDDTGSSDLTGKQQTILEELVKLGGVHPTVRSLADRLQTKAHGSERWTDAEVRGLLERLEAKGEVTQYEGSGGEQRYRPAV